MVVCLRSGDGKILSHIDCGPAQNCSGVIDGNLFETSQKF